MRARPSGLSFTLPRTQRIRKRPEFVRIQDGVVNVGRVATPHLLFLLARRSPDAVDAAPRIGVVASRKVGPAVARNRAKRLVREAFRLNQAALPRGLDLVVIIRPGTHALGLAEVAAEVVRAAPQVARRAGRAGGPERA